MLSLLDSTLFVGVTRSTLCTRAWTASLRSDVVGYKQIVSKMCDKQSISFFSILDSGLGVYDLGHMKVHNTYSLFCRSKFLKHADMKKHTMFIIFHFFCFNFFTLHVRSYIINNQSGVSSVLWSDKKIKNNDILGLLWYLIAFLCTIIMFIYKHYRKLDKPRGVSRYKQTFKNWFLHVSTLYTFKCI